MTLVLKLDMVNIYLHAKYKVPMWRGSKVIELAWTDRNTDGQAETQIDMHD